MSLENKHAAEAEFRNTVMSRNPILRWFSRKKIEKALGYAELEMEDVILDFGCGFGWMKKNYPYRITGYDIREECTEIDDYTKIAPNKILAFDVLEHMTEEQIREALKNFKRMSDFELIVAIPMENFLNRVARVLTGKSQRTKGHITQLDGILRILDEELVFIEGEKFLNMSFIGHYKSGGDGGRLRTNPERHARIKASKKAQIL